MLRKDCVGELHRRLRICLIVEEDEMNRTPSNPAAMVHDVFEDFKRRTIRRTDERTGARQCKDDADLVGIFRTAGCLERRESEQGRRDETEEKRARSSRIHEGTLLMKYAAAFVLALFCCLLPPRPAAADDGRIVGTWKLVSLVYEDAQTKEQTFPFGQHPKGRMVILASGVWIVIATAEGRKPPLTDADRADALRSMTSYTGRYHFDGDKIVTRVEAAWSEGMVGTDQTRFYQIDSDKLILTSPAQANPNVGGKVVRSIVTWQREN